MRFQCLILVIISLIALTGCQVRKDMDNSRAAYKQCLEQNLDDPTKCETLKKIYEADLAAYNAVFGGSSTAVITPVVITPRR